MIYTKEQAEELGIKETVNLKYILLRDQAKKELTFIDKIKIFFNIK